MYSCYNISIMNILPFLASFICFSVFSVSGEAFSDSHDETGAVEKFDNRPFTEIKAWRAGAGGVQAGDEGGAYLRVRATTGPDWLHVSFPAWPLKESLEEAPSEVRSFRLRYRRGREQSAGASGVRRRPSPWHATRLSTLLTLVDGRRRAVPAPACPGWRERGRFCLMASDHVRPAPAQPWTKYLAQIESKVVDPEVRDGSDVQRFAFEFHVPNCDLTPDRTCPPIRVREVAKPLRKNTMDFCSGNSLAWEEVTATVSTAFVLVASIFCLTFLVVERKVSAQIIRQVLTEQETKQRCVLRCTKCFNDAGASGVGWCSDMNKRAVHEGVVKGDVKGEVKGEVDVKAKVEGEAEGEIGSLRACGATVARSFTSMSI